MRIILFLTVIEIKTWIWNYFVDDYSTTDMHLHLHIFSFWIKGDALKSILFYLRLVVIKSDNLICG